MHTAQRDQRMHQVERLKTIQLYEIIKLYAQKVVAVAYWRWLFTRGSNCKALTGKVLVFWIGGHSWEVVTYERWLHMYGGSTQDLNDFVRQHNVKDQNACSRVFFTTMYMVSSVFFHIT